MSGTVTADTLTLTENTASTSTTTGTLIVSGGMGIAKKMYSDTLNPTNNITLDNNKNIYGRNAANDTDLLNVSLNASNAISLGDTITTDNLIIRCGAGDILTITGVTDSTDSYVTIASTKDSSSKDTGALVVEGNCLVTKKIYCNTLYSSIGQIDTTKDVNLTLQSSTNVDSTGVLLAHNVARIGNVVICSGSFQVDPTSAATETKLELSGWPFVTSNFTAVTDANGMVESRAQTNIDYNGYIKAKITSQSIEIYWFEDRTGNHAKHFTCTYLLR
jgi:hypothetical protein